MDIKGFKRIYLSSPHMSGNEQKYIDEAFAENWIAPLGPNVDAFERELAQYAGVKGAAAFSSGTAAIHLALKLVGVGYGDDVFCSTLTFAASANPIIYQGANPIFIDSDKETWNMSANALKQAFIKAEENKKIPKAVIVVNLYGQSADMDTINAICSYYNVPVIEDAAESLGATYKGKASGSFGRFGVYSFNGNKIITSSSGGMLVSNDLNALEKARFWATQSRDKARHYQHSEIGYNYRMSNILAGIGRGQLQVLQDRVEARRKIFDRYYCELNEIVGIEFMPEASFGRANRWLTVMTINSSVAGISVNNIIDALEAENIESRPVWKPLHLQPVFAKYKYFQHSMEESVSENLFKNGVCLPSGSNMSEEEQMRVIKVIKDLIKSTK